MKLFFGKILTVIFLGFSFGFSECILKEVKLYGDFPEHFVFRYEGLKEKPCERLESINQSLLEWFWNQGFPGAKISMNFEPEVVRIYLERGDAFVWALPENGVQGKTSRSVFARMTGLREGAPVSLQNLKLSESRLLRSAYYEEKSPVKLYRDQKRNRLVPVFFLEDRKANQLEGFLSYASGESGGLNGMVLVDLYNINGTARDLSVSGETGEWERKLSFNYKEPWILGTEFNGLLRGYLREDEDYKDARLEVGVGRSIGFNFDFSIWGGIGDDEWTTALEFSYKDEDRYILPRSGSRLNGEMLLLKKYEDSTHVKVFLKGMINHLIPLNEYFIAQFSGFAGTIFPTKDDFELDELYSLGGLEILKGYHYGFFKTRAYGAAELNLQWRGIAQTAFHCFFQPALHRARTPEHGWTDTYSYGIGLTQYQNSWSISLYYALNTQSDLLGGLLHLGVRSLF